MSKPTLSVKLLLSDDLNAFEGDAINGRTLFATATGFGREVGDQLQHIIASRQLTERGVLAVEKLGFAVAKEKLGTGAVGMLRAGHGDDATNVGLLIEFCFHFPTGTARAGHAGLAFLCVRAAALNHKAFDDAVESRAIIEPIAGQLLEVFDGLRRDIGPEGDSHFAVAGLENGDFVGGGFFAHGKARSRAIGSSARTKNNQCASRRKISQEVRGGIGGNEYITRPTKEEFMNIRESRQTLNQRDLDEQIRLQAYELWQQENCPIGRALDHWLAAGDIVRRRYGEVARVRLRHREKVPLLNLAEMVETVEVL